MKYQIHKINEKIQKYNEQLEKLRAALQDTNHALIEQLEQLENVAKNEELDLEEVREWIESEGREVAESHIQKERDATKLLEQLEVTRAELETQEIELAELQDIEGIEL